MKKIIYFIFLSLIVATCKCPSSRDAKKKIVSKQFSNPKRMTLNGILFDDANKMVKDFQKQPRYYNSKISFWLSNKQIDLIDNILDSDGADGLRIYLARDVTDSYNTIAIVSTFADGSDNSGFPIHIDYFNHDQNSLSKILDEKDDEDGGGATLNTASTCDDEGCSVYYANHGIKCNDAIGWVKNRNSTDVIKTKSEWFETDIIDYLNEELHANPKSDGIRIYLSKSTKDDYHHFIFVTTEPFNGTYHKDYYKCYVTDHRQPVTENGELCPTHCQGPTLPQP